MNDVVPVLNAASCQPRRPASSAASVPWPAPMALSEPKSRARKEAARRRLEAERDAHALRNKKPACIGPMVCEIEGPGPALNSEKREVVMGAFIGLP